MNGALAGLVILVLGDSHMAGRELLITPLHDDLEAAGATVHTYGMCGASADAWLTPTNVTCGRAERHDTAGPIVDISGKSAVTWSINDLLKQHHPNLVIVELGDAMAGYGSPQMAKSWVYDQVHALAGRIAASGASCVWVGPAWGSQTGSYFKTDARVREASDFLAQIVAPCAFVDSTGFSRPGEWKTTDGQHLTPAGYRLWGADIANAVVRLKTQGALH
jgi:hypothetical protein